MTTAWCKFWYFCVMNWKSFFVLLGLFFLLVLNVADVSAQCAMCSLNAENSVANGSTLGKGLNDGIMFLLGLPYLIALVIGVLWYKKFKKKNVKKVSPFSEQSV